MAEGFSVVAFIIVAILTVIVFLGPPTVNLTGEEGEGGPDDE